MHNRGRKKSGEENYVHVVSCMREIKYYGLD